MADISKPISNDLVCTLSFPYKIALVLLVIMSYTDKPFTDRQTDRNGAYRKTPLINLFNILRFCPLKNMHTVPIVCQKREPLESKHLLQYLVQPSPFIGRMKNKSFVQLTRRSKYLKADFWNVIKSFSTISWNTFIL